MKLYYSHNLNPRVAVAVAKYLQSPVQFIRANPRSPAEEEAFRAINPNTLVPVLVEGDGEGKGERDTRIWETDAIACRLSTLAQSDFWPGGADLPELIKWLSWSAHHFTQAGGVFYFENIIRPKYLGQPADQAALDNVRSDFHRFAKVLDDTLSNRTWLMNNRMSYADFRVASALPFAEAAALPLEKYRHINQWHERLNLIDAWRYPFAGLQ
jgi:glutathione S-transferase